MTTTRTFDQFPFLETGLQLFKALRRFKNDHCVAVQGNTRIYVPSFIGTVCTAVSEAATQPEDKALAQALVLSLQNFHALRGHAQGEVCTEANATPPKQRRTYAPNKPNNRYTFNRNHAVTWATMTLMSAVLRIQLHNASLLQAHPYLAHLASTYTLTVRQYAKMLEFNSHQAVSPDRLFASKTLYFAPDMPVQASVASVDVLPKEDNTVAFRTEPREIRVTLLLGTVEGHTVCRSKVGEVVLNTCTISELSEEVLTLMRAIVNFVPDLAETSENDPATVPQDLKEAYLDALMEPVLKELDTLNAERETLLQNLHTLDDKRTTLQQQVSHLAHLRRTI